MSQRSIIDPFRSYYHAERKQEYDSMEFERLQRRCWSNILSHKITDQRSLELLAEIEKDLVEQLEIKYDANNIKVDREGKVISFEINMEEIIL